MNYNTQLETRRLEQALRDNTSGKPRIFEYNTDDGNFQLVPAGGTNHSPTQFGCVCRDVMTRDFGGADVLSDSVIRNMPVYDYRENTGDVIVHNPETDVPPERPSQTLHQRFGMPLGDAFTRTFGCDVNVASVRESDISGDSDSSGEGYAYTLENEGVVRILRGAQDALAKGDTSIAAFERDGAVSSGGTSNARYVVRFGGNGGVEVLERRGNAERRIPNVAIIPDGDGLCAVGSGLLESSALKDAHALLLGCGSMGGDIAMHLAMAGVGNITLVDPDRVEGSNLSRLRDAVIADVGRRKVDVLEERILGKNPSCKVVKVGEDITKEQARMSALLADTDVAVVSTDNRRSRILFSQALHKAGKPCVFARCSTRAESGDCFIFHPGEACYECLCGAIGVAADEVDDFSSAKKAGRIAAYCRPEDMGNFAILPGISADISAITAFASRLALWELGKTLHANPYAAFSEEFLGFSYFLYINRREKYFKNEAWAPFDKSAGKPCPQRWYGAIIPRLDDCPCCSGHEDILDNGDEDAALFESMSKGPCGNHG